MREGRREGGGDRETGREGVVGWVGGWVGGGREREVRVSLLSSRKREDGEAGQTERQTEDEGGTDTEIDRV